MARDPVTRHIHRPLRDKIGFWAAILAVGVAVLSFSLNSSRVDHESKQRTQELAQEQERRNQQLQDVICGVYVPIGNSVLPPTVGVLGRTIVAATRHGAIRIHCPGVSK